jgi:hypothetical protein
MKNNFIAISIVSLGICILFGSWLIADGLRAVNEPPSIEQADFSKDNKKKCQLFRMNRKKWLS